MNVCVWRVMLHPVYSEQKTVTCRAGEGKCQSCVYVSVCVSVCVYVCVCVRACQAEICFARKCAFFSEGRQE